MSATRKLIEAEGSRRAFRAIERMDIEKAKKALEALCVTIEATGGVLHPGPKDVYPSPVGDPTWGDLGQAYILACAALGRAPVYQDKENGEDEGGDDDDDNNDYRESPFGHIG
jgi:hypothetical protein